ncbi:MAG: hypothetical protein CK425_08120 [Parachlamydia sp.]|nr:MAG: hypothetical protein CK425_08120 [Parachlamydia sp.]
MSSVSKKLDHLNVVFNCIHTKQNIKEPSSLLKAIKTPLNTVRIFAKRTYYLIRYREWHNNKSAAKVVRYHLFTADATQRKPQTFQKIEAIFQKLQPIAKQEKVKLQWVDQSWIKDHQSDTLPKFHKVKRMPKISSKMLFHLHGDSFGQNNPSLEGSSFQETLTYLNDYLFLRKAQNTSVPGISDAILEQLENAAKLARNFNNHAKSLITEAFEQNKHLLIPGGWVGIPSGHALCYEIIPESTEKATLRIFNLGAGASEHFNAIVGNKLKVLPYLEFKGISKETLLDQNTLLSLNELTSHALFPNTEERTNYNEVDIYEGLKALLKPEVISKGENCPSADSLKTLQRAGICSLRSPMAFLATCMPKADYKRLVCDLRLQSLSDRVKQCGRQPLSKLEWHLLKKSQQNLSRKIGKACENSLIGKQYAFKACADLKKIADWLEDKKEESLLGPIQDTHKSKLKWKRELIHQNEIVKSSQPLHSLETSPNAQEKIQPCSYVYQQMEALSGQELKKAIPALLKIAQTAKNSNEYQALNTSFIHFFTDLDLTSAIKNLNKDEKLQIMTDLGKISEIFFETCLRVPESSTIHPERHYTLLKILTLQQKLSGKNFNFDLGFLTYKNFFFKFRNKKAQEDFATLLKTLPQKDSELYFNTEKGSQLNFYEEHGSINKCLQKLFPDAVKELLAKKPELLTCTTSQQNAYLYASEILPGWFSAMRNTHLYLLYLHHAPIFNPSTAQVDCSLKLEASERGSMSFSIKGLTADMLNDYPKVKQVQKMPEFRYDNLFKPIQNPHLKKIAMDIAQGSRFIYNFLNEKHFLTSQLDEITLNGLIRLLSPEMKVTSKVPDELYKTLCHIAVESKLQIAETFSYFIKNPAKLNDPDYQVLFEIFFSELELLQKEMAIKGFADNLSHFLLQQVQQASEKNEIQTAVFLLKMLRFCGEYAPNHPNFMGTLPKLRNLLAQNGLSSEEKSVIYAEIVSSLAQKKTLDSLDLQDLLSGTCYLRNYPVPTQWMCPHTNKNVREALHIHAAEIKKSLAQPTATALLQKLSQEHLGTVLMDWQIDEKVGEFPHFKSAGPPPTTYYPLQARFARENERTRLPQNIIENPHVRRLFGEIHFGVLKANEIYEIHGAAAERTLIQMEGNQVVIEQLRGGVWYRFIPQEAFLMEKNGSSLSSKHLTQHFHHWQPLNNSSIIEIVNPQTGKAEYQARLRKGKVYRVTRLSDKAVLGTPSELFKNFESAEYIQEWYSPPHWYSRSHLKQVELPRYGLSFDYHPKQKKLFCKEIPGFFLSPNQHVPFLGVFNHCLVLENAKGQKKVLLPHHHFELIDKFESLEPKFNINQNLSAELPFKQTFAVFDVDPDGSLKTHAKKANLFLSYILTGAGEYAQAAHYLKKYGAKLSPYTEEEVALLTKLASLDLMTGDMDGNAIALRLYARYLLLKNCVDHNKPIPNGMEFNLTNELILYLAQFQHVTELKMNTYEESFLLKFALKEQYDTRLFIRLNELDPAFAKAYVPPPKKTPPNGPKKPVYSFKNCLPILVYDRCYNSPLDITKALITRIDHYINSNFVDIYNMAINGTVAEKKWLSDALTFAKQTTGRAERLLLECVLKNPASFPAYVCTKEDDKGRDAWWNQVKEIADTIGKDFLQPLYEEKAPPEELPNLTPVNFRLDPEPAKLPHINAVYPIPALKPFKELCKEAKCFVSTKVQAENASELKAFLKQEAEHPLCTEPLYKKKFAKLSSEINDPIQDQVTKRYQLNPQGIQKLENVLKSGKKEAEVRLKNLQIEILEIANRPSLQGVANVLQQLKREARQQKLFTLDDLLACYAKKDPTALLRRNASLDEKSVHLLFERLGELLALQTHEQQRQRAALLLQEVNACQKESEKEELIQQLATTLLDKRRYDPSQNPAYLVFEYYANMYLRSAQVGMLAKFLKEGDLNPVVEMIMGSGKSKVLLPLLALLRADGETLSMLVVPQPLFESVSSDTQKILDNAFALPLRSLHFDRNTLFSKHSLQTILDDLNRIQKEQECLILTSKSLECFILKFLKKCSDHLPRGEFPEELKLMQQILLKLEKAFPLIDEADSILNVLHEVCFSLGTKKSLVPSEVQTISLLFNLLYTDPEIKVLAQLDSDPHAIKNAPVFTEELYHEKIKQKLAEKFLARLGSEQFESVAIMSSVQSFINGLNPEHKKLTIGYLCHDIVHLEGAQAFFHQQSDEVKNILALAAEEISSFLPHTLAKNFNKKYGLDPKNQTPIAIPYAAANTPNSGSQFANSYVTMNYTFQYYAKAGVTKEIILQETSRLQSKAMNELKEHPGLTLEETEAWRTFCKLKGTLAIPLFNQKEVHIEQIVHFINASEKQKGLFVSNIILPQMDIFSHKMSCNPHNLIAFFSKRIAACTGTLWNGESMHRKLHPEPEPGIDIKTIKILRKHSLHEVHVIKEGSTEEMLTQLQAQQIFYDLMADAGGYFKEGGNTAIAKTMAQKNAKPVVFYNAKNAQTETDGVHETPLSESKTPVDKRQTFLDQSHTTGADVPQKSGAVGIVTIDENMLLRDLLQAVWRLRGLETKGQRIKFLLTQEVESIIQQKLHITNKPTFDDILRFTVMNQVQQQGKDNFKALRQELESTFQSLLLNVLVNNAFTKVEKEQAFQHLAKTWIAEGNILPKDLYGTICHEEDSAIVMQDLQAKFMDKVEEIFTALPFLETKGIPKKAASEEINDICKKYTGSLTAKVFVPLRAMDSDQTVETEQETEMQTETELETQEQQEIENVNLGLHDGMGLAPQKLAQFKFEDFNHPTPFFTLQEYLALNPVLKNYAAAFEGVHLTLNVFEWPSEKPRPEDLKLFGNYRIPFHFVEVQNDNTVVILSQHEAKQRKETAYNLAFGFYDESKPVSEELLEKIVKVEFLNGESSYSKKKQEILKKWFQEQGPEKMRTLFQQHILAGFPEKTAAYSNSHLQNIFKEMAAA